MVTVVFSRESTIRAVGLRSRWRCANAREDAAIRNTLESKLAGNRRRDHASLTLSRIRSANELEEPAIVVQGIQADKAVRAITRLIRICALDASPGVLVAAELDTRADGAGRVLQADVA